MTEEDQSRYADEGTLAYIAKLEQQLATQAEQISHLQMALADAEALELGTSDRCEKQAEQIKVAREAIEAHLNPCGCFNGCEFCNGKTTLKEALTKLGEQ